MWSSSSHVFSSIILFPICFTKTSVAKFHKEWMYSWMPWRNGTNFLGEETFSQMPSLRKWNWVPQWMNIFLHALEKWNQFPWRRILFPNSLFKEVAPSSPRKTFDCFPIIIFKKTRYDKDNISYEISTWIIFSQGIYPWHTLHFFLEK